MNVSLPFEGHSVAYQCKGLDQRNIVCEYEISPWTNDKVKIYYRNPKRKMIKLLKNNVKCQGHLKVKVIFLWKGHDPSNNVYEYEVNWFTNEKVISGNSG